MINAARALMRSLEYIGSEARDLARDVVLISQQDKVLHRRDSISSPIPLSFCCRTC